MTPPSSGPPTVATAMTAPRYPEYLPRSRGGIIAPITTWARAWRPPMPTPWITRNPISMPIDWHRPLSAEPTTKTTMAAWTRNFLLNRAASLPQIGVVAVAASREAVTTQVYCDWVPSSFEVIVGSALETMVELSSPTNRARSRPLSASSVSLLLIGASTAAGGPARWVVLMQSPLQVAAAGWRAGAVRRVVRAPRASVRRHGGPERGRGVADRRHGRNGRRGVPPATRRSGRADGGCRRGRRGAG